MYLFNTDQSRTRVNILRNIRTQDSRSKFFKEAFGIINYNVILKISKADENYTLSPQDEF